jgi:predicted MPP superfamily phosphohydrolase
MRVVQISDTHISHLGGVPTRNMELVVEYLNNHLRPDLVVNTGDIVILDAGSAAGTPRGSCT